MSNNRAGRLWKGEARGARARASMAEDDGYDWTPLIVWGSVVLLIFCCVCLCVAPSRDRSAFAYGWDWVSGERSRRQRAAAAAATAADPKSEPSQSEAMLPSLPSLAHIRLDAL